jgi:polyhydroxyalkanoate synthesis repressor PhaR
MVKCGDDFVIHEARSGKDITRSVLMHIIRENESKSNQNLLSATFMRQLIRFYGHNMQMLVPIFLEMSINSFLRQQERLRKQVQSMTFWKDQSAPPEDRRD